MNREVQTKYKKDLKTITTIVNEFDLCGLIKGGAPVDEYDCLTTLILSSVYKKLSRSKIKEQIINEFVYHFGTAESIDRSQPFLSELDITLNKLLDRIESEL